MAALSANGAVEMAWCGPACAITQGWPFLRSERDVELVEGQAELFTPETV